MMPYVISSLIALVLCTLLGYILPPVLTYILVGLVSAFLIGLVLIQRGRGGGLAGAFGGVGGSSAFGTRAGDVFTRITIVTASAWIALNMGLVVNANAGARDAQGVLGGEFLPEGVAADAGGSFLPDVDADAPAAKAGGASDAGTTAGTGAPEVPVDLPPALDGGQPPNDDDADVTVPATPKGSD